jgi:hypothetical protein
VLVDTQGLMLHAIVHSAGLATAAAPVFWTGG